ncbi:MAG TPA: hypothetical protein VMM93_02505 [Vicinamibacterales bacterium]|nr:hypothetical protein [Vicinamibacterales bacterium]
MRSRCFRTWTVLTGALIFLITAFVPVPVEAQTPFVPYFGKNRVRYDKFDWYIYKTDHFDIFYYPELEPHLERVAAYAESAYQQISGDLKHDLAGRVPMILFKTQSQFQLQNIIGAELPEGVLAFAEPFQNRMVLPIDEPPDQLYRLITHELTHVFEFDIIPRGLMGSNIPLWMDEGLANFMAGYWNTLDLMQVRDAAITDTIPKMSQFQTAPLSGRLTYSLGHAAFEFIRDRWGMEGLRQFLFSLRKSVVGSNESAYEEALKISPEEFDDEFDRYLKDRFKPFRDKERPADYGRNLAPNPQRTPYVSVVSLEPSPTGDLIAAMVGNRKDYELDVLIISSTDGQIIRNLTSGFDHSRGFEYISTSGGLRGNMVPWIAWGPTGDRLAYFVRTEQMKTLIVQNVVTGRIERRVELPSVDGPESPSFAPDGRTVAFAAIQQGVSDIFTVDLESGRVTNITRDPVADYAPAFAPDGRTIVYAGRVGGNDKLFQVDVASGTKTQITFGTHDDTSPKFQDANTVIFTSTALDPAVPVLPEVARNANIPNVWSLDLTTKDLRQWTDSAIGVVSPIVLQGSQRRVGFLTYYKGENGIHTKVLDEPVTTVPSVDFGEPVAIPDFVPPLPHSLVPDNIHKKGAFERMSLAGRPPVNLGLTSGGDIYGNTQITFTDVLGDKEISFYAQSIAQYRTTAFTFLNIGNRLQYAIQGFAQDQFFFGNVLDVLYDPSLAPFIDRDQAQAVQRVRGATAFGIYPLDRYRRLQMTGGYVYLKEEFANAGLQVISENFQEANNQARIFRSGHMLPVGLEFIQETTVFREYGPLAGNAMRVSFETSPAIGDSWISRQTVDVDLRHYARIATNGVFATRLKGFRSWGRSPDFMYFGGNSEMRGYEYLQFIGHKAFFANAELRFPLIEAMLTPIGVLGGLRGTFFFNASGAGFNGFPFTFSRSDTEIITPTIGFQFDSLGNLIPIQGTPIIVDGYRLVDGRASYGLGLQSFLLGFPMHFDWSWRTLFNKDYEDAIFSLSGGSIAFRKPRFSFWIGYDF